MTQNDTDPTFETRKKNGILTIKLGVVMVLCSLAIGYLLRVIQEKASDDPEYHERLQDFLMTEEYPPGIFFWVGLVFWALACYEILRMKQKSKKGESIEREVYLLAFSCVISCIAFSLLLLV